MAFKTNVLSNESPVSKARSLQHFSKPDLTISKDLKRPESCCQERRYSKDFQETGKTKGKERKLAVKRFIRDSSYRLAAAPMCM